METRSIVWVDANGNKTITKANTALGATFIQADLLAMSQADFLEWWEGTNTANGAPAPTGGSYRPVNQRVAFTFLCADTTQVVLVLPAPSLAIFLADKETVDITNADVVALVADCIGSLMSSTGSLATALLSAALAPSIKSPL